MLVRYMDVINMCASQVRAAAHVAADIEDSANRSFCATHPMAVLVQLRAQECYQRVSAITARLMAMKQLRRDNTGAGPRRCRSPPIVTTVVEGERRSPGSSSWRSSIRELPSLSQAGTGRKWLDNGSMVDAGLGVDPDIHL